MMALLRFFLTVLASLFKSKSRLEAENAALRHQLIVLRRKVQGRVRLTNNDRLFFVQLYRWFPSVLTFLALHLSRFAISSTFAIGSVVSSPSQRRPRAIDA